MRYSLIALVILLAGTIVLAQEAQPGATRSTSVFQDCRPIEQRVLKDKTALPTDDLSLPITHGGDMFNPVFIPFIYTAEGVAPDPNQPLAFPALLYFKFKFVPDNYSSRSPAFIYRRDQDAVKLGYDDPKAIVKYIADWQGTHAIGGGVTASAKGYTGRIVVYDTKGSVVFEKRYPDPLPYFTLMGCMVQDWMTYRQQPYTPEEVVEFERPMTTKMETVRWFGEAFQVKWRTQAEWDIFEKILATDPDFGEVRYWYANQKGWTDGFDARSYAEHARAFLSHPVISAYGAYSSSNYITDADLRARADEEILRAIKLFPHHHDMIAIRLNWGDIFTIDAKEIDARYLPSAQKYPGSYFILSRLARYYQTRDQYDKSIALDASAAFSGWMPGSGGLEGNFLRAGVGYTLLGRPWVAFSCAKLAGEKASDIEVIYRAVAMTQHLMRELLAPSTAVEIGQDFIPRANKENELDPDIMQKFVLTTYLAAYESGKVEVAEKLEPLVAKLPENQRNLCAARKAASTGDLARCKEICKPALGTYKTGYEGVAERTEQLTILADAYLLANHPDAEKTALKAWENSPRSARAAYLLKLVYLPKHAQEIMQYAEVMAWIAPEMAEYWQGLRDEALAAGAKEETRSVTALLDKAIKDSTGLIYNSPETFWRRLPLFNPEYLVMKAVVSEEHTQIERALELYLRYCEKQTGYPSAYRAHQRALFMKATAKLPDEEQATWRARLESLSEK